jgi:uncharacterized protein YjiS (DUF1127 family)
MLTRLLRFLGFGRDRVPGARELRGMSDYELKDLGIGRSEVARLADGHIGLNRWA